MITMTLKNRRLPLLGKVIAEYIQGEPLLPENIHARFVPSQLGKAIFKHWWQFSDFYPEIEPHYLQLMEEHLHGIIRVKSPMKRPLGNAIGGFKTWCNRHYAEIVENPNAKLFSDGFQDTILFNQGQLNAMYNYLADNPRRLAIKRLFPDLFTITRNIHYEKDSFVGYGNCFLLQSAVFHCIQASRHKCPDTMSTLLREMNNAIQHEATIISPCISPNEKELVNMAFSQGAKLISLSPNGFPPLYKPPGKMFDACAEGRLLILTPSCWEYTYANTPITREKACFLNDLAMKISAAPLNAAALRSAAPQACACGTEQNYFYY